tara:strand:+ start:146 stop:385 length:240 start_codon:yes stop_codon:yes gene_type:complete
MGDEKYIIPIQYSDEGYQFWAYSGLGWPEGMEYLLWPEVAIIRDKINEVISSRHLNEMSIVTDEQGEEKRPNFLTKLKF